MTTIRNLLTTLALGLALVAPGVRAQSNAMLTTSNTLMTAAALDDDESQRVETAVKACLALAKTDQERATCTPPNDDISASDLLIAIGGTVLIGGLGFFVMWAWEKRSDRRDAELDEARREREAIEDARRSNWRQ